MKWKKKAYSLHFLLQEGSWYCWKNSRMVARWDYGEEFRLNRAKEYKVLRHGDRQTK